MASKLPLWRKRIPKLAPFFKGDPQRQMLLPLFWMKIVKPKDQIPKDMVHFQIHPQMSKLDVKQYLEKIYQVNVLSVRTETRQGQKVIPSAQTFRVRHEDEKFAYVQLQNDVFVYPDFELDKGHVKRQQNQKSYEEKLDKSNVKMNQGIPRWFS